MNSMSKEINEEMQKRLDLYKAVVEVVEKLIEAIRPLIDLCKRVVTYISNCPNKRMIHLALYAKKERMRKKDRNRIFNDVMKEW